MYGIETERLTLRGLEETDAPPLIGMLSSPSVMRLLFSGVPMTFCDARSFIAKHFTFGESPTGIGVLEERETKQFVGFAGLLPCRYLDKEDFEIGAAFVEESQHKGYGMEVGSAQITYGLEKMKLPRLLALAHPDNINSIKVIESLGMRFVEEIATEERGPRRIYIIERPARYHGNCRR
jgi:[ribosomal protein S5]-alanine N-acetyltransferase